MNNSAIECEFRVLNGSIRRYFENSPNRKMAENLTGSNGRIIGFLYDRRDRDVFQRDIERDFGITRSTASKVVELMRKKGYIEKSPVSYDARLKKLTLTDKASELVSYMLEDRKILSECVWNGFSDAEKDKIAEYIGRMKENMEKIICKKKDNK